MLQRCARQGVVGGVALAVGLAGLTMTQGAAHAAAPLAVSQAGPVAIWGPDGTAPSTRPTPTDEQASEAFTKVVANGSASAIGLTAEGKVELIGTNVFSSYPQYSSINLPAELVNKTTVDIAGDGAGYGDGIAVTSDGDVYTWDLGIEGWATHLPDKTDLQGSTAAAISTNAQMAAVVKQDGSVLVWGSNDDYGQQEPPEGLSDVSSVSFGTGGHSVYALKTDGTLAAWGDNSAGQTDLPPITTDTSDDVNVVEVANDGLSEVALLSDGSLVAWGSGTAADPTGNGALGPNDPPAEIASHQIVALGANTTAYFAVDSTGQIYTWGESESTLDPAFTQLPEGVDPSNITGLSMNAYYVAAIQAKYAYLAKPTISGTAKVGQTLTATHATFTADPDTVTGQWLANGAKIAGATGTTLKLTAAQVGKRITYSETGTRGTESATATSDPTAKVAALSTGGGNSTTQPGSGHTTPPVVQNPKLVKDQAKLKKDQAKLKKFKKKLKKAKKAHNAKKIKKLKKKVKKLKKSVKKDRKNIKADR